MDQLVSSWRGSRGILTAQVICISCSRNLDMTVSSRKIFPNSHEFTHKLLTIIVNRALYLRGDPYENSDAVFGV